MKHSPPTRQPLFWWLAMAFLLAWSSQSQVQAQSYSLTSLWSIAPGTPTYPFMDTANTTRGLAYNPVTGHVLVASRTGSAAVHIVNGTTGDYLGTLPFDPSVVTGGTFTVNMVDVTDDGVIYVGNLTTDAADATKPFKLYRWANETAQPVLVYSGDPSGGDAVASNRRFGDSLALRGAGTNTQILLGTLDKNVAWFTTLDGTNFTAAKIVTDGAAADARWGLAWGAGDTFWAKQPSGNLKKFSLNKTAGTASVVLSVSGLVGAPLGVDLSRNLLGLVEAGNHKLRLYDITEPMAPLQQDTTRDFPAANANGNGTGAAVVRDGKLFALESNNGILAFSLGTVYAPVSIATPPASVTVWEGAQTYTFTVGVTGSRPLSYQWLLGGQAIAGATTASLTLSNINASQQGVYSVVVTNPVSQAVSDGATLTVTPGNATSLLDNLWNLLPGSRPYVTSGYMEYGLAINPLTTNVIVLTRQNPTTMVAVVDIKTGDHKRYISTSALGTPGLNRVDVADDGKIYACAISTDTSANPFNVYRLSDDSATPAQEEIVFSGDPGSGQVASDVVWGGTFRVRGAGANTQILLGSGNWNKSSQTVAILRVDSGGAFYSTPITVPDAPDKFSRLGVSWGPGTNTIWAKSVGNLLLIEFDLSTGTGFVRQNYPTSGLRSVPWSVTGIDYDPATQLLAGLQNGSPPTPVSIPVYDVSDEAGGPFWADQELFTTYNADIEYQGCVDFGAGYLVALGLNNGIKAFRINPHTGSLPLIVTQPVGTTTYRGTDVTFGVAADSLTPMTYQWYFNGNLIADATDTSLTLTNVQVSQTGNYVARVTNTGGSRDSRPAVLTVLEPYSTGQMTNIWSLAAGSRPYLNTGYSEYGMAFNPATSNLLVISLASGVTVAVVDALTGDDKSVLDVSVVSGGSKPLHKIDVADDGAIYACNLATASASDPFTIYRWANDNPSTVATVAFSGDPAPLAWPDHGCGYTFSVRGAGANTEILVGLGAWNATSNVVAVLKTTDGRTFTANEIVVPAAPAGFSRLGLCFGAGNTFWAKTWQGQLYLVQYDLAAHTGTILKSYGSSAFPTAITTLAYNQSLNFLAGIANETEKNVQLFSVADLAAGPQLRDQEMFPTFNPSIEANGALDFGGNNYLFALNENNGIMAFRINTNYVPPVTSFKILNATAAAGTLTIKWQATPGKTYQVLATDSLTGTWSNLGNTVTATNTTATYVDSAPAATRRFYRVQAK